MSDEADLAERHEAFSRDIAIRAARSGAGELAHPGAFLLCDECGDAIEAERRRACPGARRCILCQEAAERALRFQSR